MIKAKLINYKDNLEREDKKQQFELEKLRLQQSAFQINNTATNTNDNTAIVNNSVNFNLDQTIENIHSLPETVLSKSDKEILEDKLSAIELALKKKDKSKLFDKLGES